MTPRGRKPHVLESFEWIGALTLGALLALGCSASRAVAQGLSSPAVELSAGGLFGQEAFVSGGFAAMVVRAANRTASPLRGEVVVEVRAWDRLDSVHRVSLDLPPREARATTLTVPALSDGLSYAVTYRVGGTALANASTSLAYAGSGSAVVLLDDPPRLRAPLLGTQVTVFEPYNYPQTREVELPVGVASTDGRSGDPILPTDAAGWSNVRLAISTVPTLGRAGEAELTALERWVRAGGRLLVMPTRAADLDHPFLRRTVGALSRSDEESPVARTVLGTASAERALACPGDAARERFGCQVHVGFGTLWVTDLDLSDANAANHPETQELLRSIARASDSSDARSRPVLPFARGTDGPGLPYMPAPNLHAVTRALDPNESYRPALLLVAGVLLLYVVLVGPVNFTLVERRKQPTLALVTTPILALICTAATFLVGLVGKGVLMRYRRIETLDAIEGSDSGVSRRYTGFFYTRPATVDVDLAPGAVALRLGGATDGPVVVEGAERRTLREMRAGLWETAFVREDDTPSLGGSLRFELDGTRFARVHNDSTLALHGAFMTDRSGGVYAIGELAPGGVADIPTTASSYIGVGDRPSGEFWSSGDAFLGTLGYQSDAREAVTAMMGMGEQAPVQGNVPVLWARLDPGAPPSAAPEFERELDLRLLRIVPRSTPVAITVPSTTVPEHEAQGTLGTATGGAP
jgi:hypothetical protein